MIKCVVYEIINPLTDKTIYIGQTSDFIKRKNTHIHRAKNKNYRENPELYKHINGIINCGKLPVFNVIDEVFDNEIDDVEIYWISQYRAWGIKLFNIHEGGKSRRGFIPWNKGKQMSEETKSKMSISRTGIKQSQETINKRIRRGENHYNFGNNLSSETIQKISDTRIKKKIQKLNPITEEVIESFDSITDASKLGFNKSAIINCCNGKPKFNTSGGFKWKYAI